MATKSKGLEPLKSVPAAFISEANKINELVAAINSLLGMRTTGPLQFKFDPKKNPNTGPVLHFDMQAFNAQQAASGNVQTTIGLAGVGGSGGGGTTSELHYNDGSTQIDIDGTGITLTDLIGGNVTQIDNGGTVSVFNDSTGKTLTIDPTLITHNMAIQTWAVCNSGTPASALVLASAPF